MQLTFGDYTIREHKRFNAISDRQQVIDVPVLPLVLSKMPPYPLDETVPGRTRIDIPSCGKTMPSEATNADYMSSPEVNS